MLNIRVVTFITCALYSGIAMTAQPQEPELQKAALQYLGVHAQILALKQSECAMGVTGAPKSYEDVLGTEVLPAFPAGVREERRKSFISAKPALIGGGDSYIKKMLEETARSGNLSKDFRCGYITGLITSAWQQSRKAWSDLLVQGAGR